MCLSSQANSLKMVAINGCVTTQCKGMYNPLTSHKETGDCCEESASTFL